jgi:protein SMG8
MPHCSGVTYTSACNCGRKQTERTDPFTLVEANFKFYLDAEEECCRDLEHIAMPFYTATASKQ